MARSHLPALFAMVIALGPLVGPAAGDPVQETGAVLPTPRFGGSASWNGRFVYYAGGQGCNGGGLCDEIVRYDPVGQKAQVMTAHLPTARKGTVSFSDGRFHYIIGGYDGQDLSTILRYDPETDTIEPMTSKLFSPMTFGSVVWNGQYAFILGGFSGERWIIRYDPHNDKIAKTSLSLPSERHYTSAVWIGQSIYVFGGESIQVVGGERQRTDLAEIVRLTPSDGTMAVSSAVLPTVRHATGAFTDGRVAYIIGGETACQGFPCDRPREILKFDPATDTLVPMPTPLFEGRAYPETVGDSHAAFVLGGIGCATPSGFCDSVLTLAMPAPSPVSIVPAGGSQERHWWRLPESFIGWLELIAGVAGLIGAAVGIFKFFKHRHEKSRFARRRVISLRPPPPP